MIMGAIEAYPQFKGQAAKEGCHRHWAQAPNQGNLLFSFFLSLLSLSLFVSAPLLLYCFKDFRLMELGLPRLSKIIFLT